MAVILPSNDSSTNHASQATVAWWLGVPLAVLFIGLSLTRDRHFSLGKRALALPVMAFVALVASWVFAAVAAIALVWRVPLREPAG